MNIKHSTLTSYLTERGREKQQVRAGSQCALVPSSHLFIPATTLPISAEKMTQVPLSYPIPHLQWLASYQCSNLLFFAQYANTPP